MKFHPKQLKFIDDVVGEIKNNPKSKKPVLISLASAPGSGKTTVLTESSKRISEFLSKNIKYVESNVPEKQVLMLVFDKKMKNELLKKISKNPDINEDLFEITTVNSLFFRELKDFQKNLSKENMFELDYTRSNFTKKMIRYFLKSLIVGGESLSPNIDKEINDYRVLPDDSFMTDENIATLHALVNTYFLSPYPLRMINDIEKDAVFFKKDGASLEDIYIPELLEEKLTKLKKDNNSPLEIREILFRMIIKRINQLAIAKEKIKTIKTVKMDIPMEIQDAQGNIVKAATQEITKEKEEVEIIGNLIKVPHSYYYKTFYNQMIKSEDLARKVFGKYKIVMVDEAQDNDRILFKLILRLATLKIIKNFAFVGDPLQGIYAFKSPDHFDMLTFMEESKEMFEKMGIDYRKHDLDITYRFNQEISDFINSLFGSSIKSIATEKRSFVYPEQIPNDSLHNLVKNITNMTDKTLSIICRSNAEAVNIFMKLKAKGVENVVIHSSFKDELKNFSKKGIEAIDNERVKNEISRILSSEFKEKDFFSFEEILSSENAIRYLQNNGYSHLVKFSKDEIEKYIIPANRKKKDIVWIGTAHLFKGAEFDYTIVASDFFKPKEDRVENLVRGDFTADIATNNTLIDFFNGNSFEEPQAENHIEEAPAKPLSRLKDEIHNPDNNEEKCIYYVALTRSKEGLFFCETPHWDELKQNISNSSDIKQELSWILDEPVEADNNISKEIDMSHQSLFADALLKP